MLVYAETGGSEHHAAAMEVLRSLAQGGEAWAIPWPCVYEHLRVVTHPRGADRRIGVEEAWRNVGSLLAAPNVALLSETPRHAEVLAGVLRQSGVTGNLIHDAHIVALCLEHGVSELITGDRDFARFRGLRFHNPFEGRG